MMWIYLMKDSIAADCGISRFGYTEFIFYRPTPENHQQPASSCRRNEAAAARANNFKADISNGKNKKQKNGFANFMFKTRAKVIIVSPVHRTHIMILNENHKRKNTTHLHNLLRGICVYSRAPSAAKSNSMGENVLTLSS